MSKFSRIPPLMVMLLLLASATAFADVRPPVSVELLGEPRAARAGEIFAGELRITSGEPATLAEPVLEGLGWQSVGVDALPQASITKDQAVTVGFSALCQDPDAPLVFSFRWNGQLIREQLDLSPKAARQAVQSVRVVPLPGREEDPTPLADPAAVSPKPASSGREPADIEEMPASGADKRIIRVRGRFVYTRPDGVEIGVDGMTVRIYDDDPVGDDHLTDTITDTDGRFDVTFDFDDYWEDYPDIYIVFDAVNTEVEVEHPTWGYVYSWETGVYDDVSSYLNIGTVRSGEEDMEPALHLLTAVTRTWRWCNGYGYNPSYVEVEWPDGDEGAWYTDISEEIHISSERQWSDRTPTHEYGHHFLHNYAPTADPDYCNGVCDDDEPWDCGHCVWCEEDAQIAWSEGFPNYLAYVIPMQYITRYGIAAADTLGVQSLNDCNNTHYDPPTTTEGFVAAVLVDIHDSETNENHSEYPDFRDRLNMGPEEILSCVDDDVPSTVMGFLLEFKDRNPAVKAALWETAANCGYDIDEENPAAPSTIYSSHSVGIASPDATVQMDWLTPSDDASGVVAYSYIFRTGSPGAPDTTEDVWDNACTSTTLAPGTYYFCIRSRDWADNWSTSYGSYGPIIIRAPDPCNLTEYARAGWDFPIVPSSSNTNTVGSTHVSATLPGGTYTTYWNVSGRNNGESATPVDVRGIVYIDGAYLSLSDNFGTINANSTFYRNNRGPFMTLGGRHVMHYMFDYPESIGETNEDDNTMGHQFVWTPVLLQVGVVESQPSMEHALSGWEHVHDGSTLYFNCRGLRMHNAAWWNVAAVWPHEVEDNYDLRLHNISTGAQNGFSTLLESSSRGAGCLDAIIVNSNTVTTADFDIGVIFPNVNYDLGFDATYYQGQFLVFDAPLTRTLGPSAWLRLHEFNVTSEHVGSVSVLVETNPPTANVYVQWRGEDFTYGGLSDNDAAAVTGADGTAILQFTVPETGYNSICLYRDPIDGETDIDVTFELRETPPDLTPYWAAGWAAPLVPRPAADGTPTSVARPDTLHGNMSLTYHNLAVRNLSPADAESVRAYVWLDGQTHAALLYPSFPGGAYARYNYTFPYTVRGGRHTLSLNIDAYDRIEELSETNNVYGEQYVWSPFALNAGAGVARSAPPEMTGGWTYVTSGEPRYYDCDGLRLSNLTGWWAAMAVMPGDTSNVDVRLHQTFTGAKNGFAANLAYSSWGVGCSDYVLVNFNLVTRAPHDAGVLRVSGVQNYTANCVQEVYLGTRPQGTYGPYSMGANSILRLHEMHLDAGLYAFRLDNTSGNVNWGMCLHPQDQPYLKKSTVVPNGSAWAHGPGQCETFAVEIPETDYYCLAVWKSGAADLPLTGQYTLRIEPGLTAVEDNGETPARTRLAAIHPNPFNPQTTIAFDLAAPAPVRVVIHDLTGARVRVLVDEARPAGRHSVVWNGRDDAGRRVASGSYVARLVAGEVRETRKLVMVK